MTLINSGAEVAKLVSAYLNEHNMAHNGQNGSTRYYVTDRPHNFSTLATLFLGNDISDDVTKVTLEKNER